MKSLLTILLPLALVGCASAQIPPQLPPKPVPQPPVEVIATVLDTNTAAVKFYRGSDGGVWVYATTVPLTTGSLFPASVRYSDSKPSRYYGAVGVGNNGAESESIGTTNLLFLTSTNPPSAPRIQPPNKIQ